MGKNGKGKRGKTKHRQTSNVSGVMPTPEYLAAKNINATIMVLRGFLTPEDITALKTLGPKGEFVKQDRTDELNFEHEVWRFEKELLGQGRGLHEKVLNAMYFADEQLWRGIPPQGSSARKKLHAEVEFISYNAEMCKKRGGCPPHIGPHVDNSSAVTLIGMLSSFKAGDYEGGMNRFEVGDHSSMDAKKGGGIGDGRFREIRLGKGDVLIFRGEMVEHSLTPVSDGLRQILQIELCRQKEERH